MNHSLRHTNHRTRRSSEAPSLIRARNKSRWFRIVKRVGIVVAIILAVCGILIGPNVGPLRTAYRAGMEGKRSLLDAQSTLKAEQFTDAADSLSIAESSFIAMDDALAKTFLIDDIPGLRGQFSALRHLAVVGEKTTRGLRVVIEQAHAIIEPIVGNRQFTIASLTKSEKRDILKGIAEAGPTIQEAQQLIDEAARELAAIPAHGLLSPVQKAVVPIRELLPTIQRSLKDAEPLTSIVPTILGYPDERTYLFLLENNTELRPAGGFIGTYGIIRLANGEVESFTTDNVYNLDSRVAHSLRIPPPEPLWKYNKVEALYLRDSNWSPDFPTAAKEALRFYQLESGSRTTLHGVIAITPTLIEDLLRLVGDISVQGVTFTAEEFTATLQDQVSRGYLREGIPQSDRKDIIGELGTILLNRVLALPQSRWATFAGLLDENLKEKHLLLFTTDEALESKIQESNWGGAVQPYVGDYLLAVDANLASLKSDPAVQRSIRHAVARDGDRFVATTTLEYRNEGTITWKTTRYRTYVRLYVPQGSILRSVKGADLGDRDTREGSVETTAELGKTVFGAFKSIEPKETETIEFVYELPATVTDQLAKNAWTLRVQKQPGAANYNLAVSLDIGRTIRSFSPLDSGTRDGHTALRFSTQLSSDREFTATFQ